MTTQISTRTPFLEAWLSRWIPTAYPGESFTISALAGDGSTRQFFRVQTPRRRFALLSDPEWTLSKDYAPHQEYLKRVGIRVPDFLRVDAAAGVLVMQDLGDELLQQRVIAEPEKAEAHIADAVRLLAHLHGKTFPVPTDLPVSQRRFDRKKYSEELRFTLEHLAVGFLKLPSPTPLVLETIDRYCEQIQDLGPSVFCHRDYHTRNILIFENHLYLIDFQDARLGPPFYDLASILFDPYVPVSEASRNRLEEIYYRTLDAYEVNQQIRKQTRETDLFAVAFQRVVKAAGSFASFYTRYGKNTHLPYLMPALQSAQSLLEKFDPPKGLREAIPLSMWIEKAKVRIPQVEQEQRGR